MPLTRRHELWIGYIGKKILVEKGINKRSSEPNDPTWTASPKVYTEKKKKILATVLCPG